MLGGAVKFIGIQKIGKKKKKTKTKKPHIN